MFNFEKLSNKRRTSYLIVCFALLPILGYLIYDTVEDINNKKHTSNRGDSVVVTKRYHWKTDSVTYVDSGDPNVMIAIAHANPVPVVTTMKEGEVIDQETGWQELEKAQQKYFNQKKSKK